MPSGSFSFLSRREFQILSIVLGLQAVCLYGISRQEVTPIKPPLASVPDEFPGGWHKIQEGVIEKEVQDVLQADDLLNRVYAADGHVPVNLFVASFQTQRDGKAPHSPKNCLPGAGWTPVVSDRPTIRVPGRAEPITINRYVIQKGPNKSIVLYWYASHNRVVASEYMAKIDLVLDAIRYNRSDTSLVRVVTDATDMDTNQAMGNAVAFVQASYPKLQPYMP